MAVWAAVSRFTQGKTVAPPHDWCLQADRDWDPPPQTRGRTSTAEILKYGGKKVYFPIDETHH